MARIPRSRGTVDWLVCWRVLSWVNLRPVSEDAPQLAFGGLRFRLHLSPVISHCYRADTQGVFQVDVYDFELDERAPHTAMPEDRGAEIRKVKDLRVPAEQTSRTPQACSPHSDMPGKATDLDVTPTCRITTTQFQQTNRPTNAATEIIFLIAILTSID